MQTDERRWILTLGLVTGTFLGALESTVVGTVMPTVVAQLGGLDLYSWVFSAYLLSSTVTVPVWGRLSDIYGRKKIYVTGIALFLAGSALSGQSSSMGELIGFRALQGLGTGAIIPVAVSIVGDIYTTEERARMQGLFSAVWAVASIVGPLAGGFITDHLSWRWVFYVNIPFGIASGAVIALSLAENPNGPYRVRIDYAGGATLAAAIALLLLALLGTGAGWPGWQVAAMFGGSMLLLPAFFWIEGRAPEPMIPSYLFANSMFRAAAINGFLAGVVLFGSISFMPLFVHAAMRASAIEAGSVLTPLLLGWVVAAIPGSRLILTRGYRTLVVTGMGLVVAGFAWLVTMTEGVSRAALLLDMFCIGTGMGLVMPVLLIGVQNAVPRAILGVATATTQFFRSIGGAVGVAIMGAVLSNRLASKLADSGRPDLIHAASRMLEPYPTPADPASSLPHATVDVDLFRSALEQSLHSVFVLCLIVALLALFSAFMVPKSQHNTGV
jgi:EmrB/QacA subfamily drug resistance transporter